MDTGLRVLWTGKAVSRSSATTGEPSTGADSRSRYELTTLLLSNGRVIFLESGTFGSTPARQSQGLSALSLSTARLTFITSLPSSLVSPSAPKKVLTSPTGRVTMVCQPAGRRPKRATGK